MDFDHENAIYIKFQPFIKVLSGTSGIAPSDEVACLLIKNFSEFLQ